VVEIILLDGVQQLYRCNYKLSDLVTRTGRPSGMEYGFLKGIEAFRRFFKDELIICWEGRKNFRYGIDPEYKANRKAKREKVAHEWMTPDRMSGFRELLSKVAENCWDDELEADDVMATLALRYAKTEKVIIYSGDKDMFQILQDEPYIIHQCRDYQHRNKLWTPRRLAFEMWGLTPQLIPPFMAYMGDKVDNVIGVGRVRQSLVARAICDGHTPDNISDYLLFSGSECNRLEEHVASGNYAKNLELVTLRIKDDIQVVKRNWQPVEINAWLKTMEFRTLKLCEQVGIEATIEEGEEF